MIETFCIQLGRLHFTKRHFLELIMYSIFQVAAQLLVRESVFYERFIRSAVINYPKHFINL
ncbi:MAG: hypothetical protein L6N96_04120 [Candidatus Methylarchaceae archaeon HK02M2]|nr:hypothetical protein [Candidatus Methylarchaceae archaeon HK02M2]